MTSPTSTRPTKVSLEINGPPVMTLGDGERTPNITMTIENGVDVLTYWLCQTCLTLQTRIGRLEPVTCADCCDLEEPR